MVRDEAAQQEAPQDRQEQQERRERRPVVVAVNDNEAALYMTSLMLRKGGFEVLEAHDGKTALELAERMPDVIVLDVHLPDMDGFEVCRRIRANARTAPIKILHTSATFVSLEKKVHGLESGADGYLTQPFESQELVATVQSLVRLSVAEGALRERAAELVEASRRKDEFLAMLAHELRNPLSAISASLPLVFQQTPLNDKEERAREIVGRQVKNLAALVDDLLDVARVTQGKIELHVKMVNLGELLKRVMSSVRDTRVTPRKQALSLELPEGPLFVKGDITRLEQVFVNLLDNASKYTDPGGSIHVTVDRIMDGIGGAARISVRDTGIGIAGDMLPSIFDLFSQANVAIDRSRGGLGIGLTLVKTLVERHGGRVTAKSDGIGKGCLFEVELPLVLDESAAKALPSRPSMDGSTNAPPRRILLVEDNADARQVLADLWETWGHQVCPAEDGVEGVECALAVHPDIAFIDLGLPGLDGYEVAERIRAADGGADLLLVALTGYGSPEQKARAFESGFDHYIVKPVDTKNVKKLLSDLDAVRATSHRAVRRPTKPAS